MNTIITLVLFGYLCGYVYGEFETKNDGRYTRLTKLAEVVAEEIFKNRHPEFFVGGKIKKAPIGKGTSKEKELEIAKKKDKFIGIAKNWETVGVMLAETSTGETHLVFSAVTKMVCTSCRFDSPEREGLPEGNYGLHDEDLKVIQRVVFRDPYFAAFRSTEKIFAIEMKGVPQSIDDVRGKHAEVKLMEYYQQGDYVIQHIVASKPYCDNCKDYLNEFIPHPTSADAKEWKKQFGPYQSNLGKTIDPNQQAAGTWTNEVPDLDVAEITKNGDPHFPKVKSNDEISPRELQPQEDLTGKREHVLKCKEKQRGPNKRKCPKSKDHRDENVSGEDAPDGKRKWRSGVLQRQMKSRPVSRSLKRIYR